MSLIILSCHPHPVRHQSVDVHQENDRGLPFKFTSVPSTARETELSGISKATTLRLVVHLDRTFNYELQLSYGEHEASQSQNGGTRRTRSRMTFILNPHKTPNSFYSPSPPRSTIGRIIENLGERGTSIENCTFLHFVVELLVAPDTQSSQFFFHRL